MSSRSSARAGTEPPLGNTRDDAPPPRWVRNGQLAKNFNCSAMCIWRWKRDPSLGCPPAYEVNGIEWNDLNAWDAWMRQRLVLHAQTRGRPRDRRKAKARAHAGS